MAGCQSPAPFSDERFVNERQARTIIAAQLEEAARPGAAEECRAGKGYHEMVKAVTVAYHLGELSERGKGLKALNMIVSLANTPWRQWQSRKKLWAALAEFWN